VGYPFRFQALTKLQGKAIGKRTVFAAAYKPKPSRPSTGSSRYYHQNIHVKCTRCGEVGHAASSCSKPPLPTPCYLCGGTDHMDWECPNIVCFNCGGFGHHSRQCKKPSSNRARVCTRCGSTRHDKTVSLCDNGLCCLCVLFACCCCLCSTKCSSMCGR
jgi:hypothetical protein